MLLQKPGLRVSAVEDGDIAVGSTFLKTQVSHTHSDIPGFGVSGVV